MLLVRVLLSPHLIPEALGQYLHVFSVSLGAWLIIAACIEVDWALDALDQADFIAAVEVFHVEGWVDGSDGLDVVKLCRHTESCPSSPAIPGSEECFKTTTFDMYRKLLIPCLNFFNLLSLDDLKNFRDVLNGALINWVQKFRQEYCEA